MIVLILLFMTEIFADKRLRGGCSVKDNEAPWVVYIRNCALYNVIDSSQVKTITKDMPYTTKTPRFRPSKQPRLKDTTSKLAK